MKTIIAGSRDITDPRHVWDAVREAQTEGLEVTEVVTGGARGVDTIAHNGATKGGIDTTVMHANWEGHGKAAGPIRNRRMAEYADALIAVWDGKSRGTKNMIDEARKRGLAVWVHRIDE